MPYKNGNPEKMLTAGDEVSSPTGSTLSPISDPNGKNIWGTDGSVRLSTVTEQSDATSSSSAVRVVIAARTSTTCGVTGKDIYGSGLCMVGLGYVRSGRVDFLTTVVCWVG